MNSTLKLGLLLSLLSSMIGVTATFSVHVSTIPYFYFSTILYGFLLGVIALCFSAGNKHPLHALGYIGFISCFILGCINFLIILIKNGKV